MNALTSLLAAAVNEVHEEEFIEYERGQVVEEEWWDFVGDFVMEWARAAGFPAAFVGRADQEERLARRHVRRVVGAGGGLPLSLLHTRGRVSNPPAWNC